MFVEALASHIESRFEELGYAFFDNDKPYNVNIIGVRNDNKTANSFNDNLILLYRDSGLRWNLRVYPITTDAGAYWLINPMSVQGTALLREGQWRGCYKIGKHKGYKALVQAKDVEVYRDDNKDLILDYEEASIEKGIFGINIHRSNPYGESMFVGKWSAGCQVFANKHDYDDFIGICEKSAERFGNSFTYTLINEEKFG